MSQAFCRGKGCHPNAPNQGPGSSLSELLFQAQESQRSHRVTCTWLLQQAASLCAMAGNRSLAILFSSARQICHLPDGSKGSSVAWQPAVTFCKKSTAWWPPRTSALLSGQWPHHQPCAISARQWHRVLLGWFLPQKTFAAPCEEELILTYFHSFLAQTGLIVLHITFCSRKTTHFRRAEGHLDVPVLTCTELDEELRDLLSEWPAQRAQTFVWQSAETGPQNTPVPWCTSSLCDSKHPA